MHRQSYYPGTSGTAPLPAFPDWYYRQNSSLVFPDLPGKYASSTIVTVLWYSPGCVVGTSLGRIGSPYHDQSRPPSKLCSPPGLSRGAVGVLNESVSFSGSHHNGTTKTFVMNVNPTMKRSGIFCQPIAGLSTPANGPVADTKTANLIYPLSAHTSMKGIAISSHPILPNASLGGISCFTGRSLDDD